MASGFRKVIVTSTAEVEKAKAPGRATPWAPAASWQPGRAASRTSALRRGSGARAHVVRIAVDGADHLNGTLFDPL